MQADRTLTQSHKNHGGHGDSSRHPLCVLCGAAKGFTLIELMLVLAVIGIVYGLVFMRLDHVLSGYRLRGDAREVLAAMELARSEAISQQNTFRVVFDLNQGVFWLDRASDDRPQGSTRPGDAVVHRLDSGIRVDCLETPGAKWTRGKAAIAYSPLGCASVNRICIASRDGRTIWIEVNPLNGYARVRE